MNHFNLLLLLFLLCFWNCKKEGADQAKLNQTGKLTVIQGNNQTNSFGEFLKDSIIVQTAQGNSQQRFTIRYELIQGNGFVVPDDYVHVNDKDCYPFDSKGIFKFKWNLGCNFNVQKIKLILYADGANTVNGSAVYYHNACDSVIITANATKPVGWIKSCGCHHFDFFRTKIITHDGSTLYMVNEGLYTSVDGGLNWAEVTGIPVPAWDNIVNADFNSQGWLYVLTRESGVCYSKDLKNWEFINTGIKDPREPTTFLVEDSVLFAGFNFDGLYKTSNNGSSWRKLLEWKSTNHYYHITRHPGGALYFIDKWNELWVSENYGDTWTQINLDYKYSRTEAIDLKIDRDGFIYIGTDDATISKISPPTYQGEFHSNYVYNSSSQRVGNITVANNDVYYVVLGNPKGICSKSSNWNFMDIGFNKNVYFFYLKKDNEFLVLSDDDRLYYHNK